MVEINIIIGITIGLTAYILVNLGRGFQKMGLEGLKTEKKVKSKHSGIWIFGSFLAIIYMFIQWIALLFAPINVIAPLEGVGLIVLVLFSYFILHEDISKTEILGISLITLGIVFGTAFNPNPSTIQAIDFNIMNYIIVFCCLFFIEGILIVILKFKLYNVVGLILGLTAGTFNAFQTVSKRITAIPDTFLRAVFSIITLIIALLTFLVTQFAFAKSKANIIVPCFTSASISLSILIGIIALNELINIVQISGIIVLVVGVVFLTAFRKKRGID